MDASSCILYGSIPEQQLQSQMQRLETVYLLLRLSVAIQRCNAYDSVFSAVELPVIMIDHDS
jgi:hypothetical protein